MDTQAHYAATRAQVAARDVVRAAEREVAAAWLASIREAVRAAEREVAAAWLASIREAVAEAAAAVDSCHELSARLRTSMRDAQRGGELDRIVALQTGLEATARALAESVAAHAGLQLLLADQVLESEAAGQLRAREAREDRNRLAMAEVARNCTVSPRARARR